MHQMCSIVKSIMNNTYKNQSILTVVQTECQFAVSQAHCIEMNTSSLPTCIYRR